MWYTEVIIVKNNLYKICLLYPVSKLFYITAYAGVRVRSVKGGDSKTFFAILIICAIVSFIAGIYNVNKGEEVPEWASKVFISSIISIVLNLLIVLCVNA